MTADMICQMRLEPKWVLLVNHESLILLHDIFKNTPQLITVDQMNLASLTAQGTQGAIRREERTTPDASPLLCEGRLSA